MKCFIVPVSSAVLATALSVYGCHRMGMPRADLVLATLVSGTVSVTAAVCAVGFAKSRPQPR
jgi:hypothetical protein